MTTLCWDSQEIRQQFATCANLKEVIVKIENDFSKKGEVICEIRVNGVRLNESDEARYAESRLEAINDLSVSINRADSLILDALVSAHAFVPELEKSCVATGDSLRGSEISLAQKQFGETLEGCQWLIDTVGHIRGAASGIGQPVERTERWFEAERVIAKVVREISTAYEAGDSVLVADLLEYEMTGALHIWQEVIESERFRRAA
jgi:hypothetical protein